MRTSAWNQRGGKCPTMARILSRGRRIPYTQHRSTVILRNQAKQDHKAAAGNSCGSRFLLSSRRVCVVGSRSVCQSVCLSCLCVCLFVCQSVSLSVCLVCLSVCLSVYLSVGRSVGRFSHIERSPIIFWRSEADVFYCGKPPAPPPADAGKGCCFVARDFGTQLEDSLFNWMLTQRGPLKRSPKRPKKQAERSQTCYALT